MDFWKVRFGNGCHAPGRAYCQYFSPALRVEIEESVNPGFQHPGVSGNRPVFPLRSHRRFFAIYIYLIFLICDIESNLITFEERNQPPVSK